MSPLVSVIVPLYNCEPYLRACIDSLLAQTMGDFELLLVDDGSKDGTLTAAREFGKDSRVRIFTKPNGGAASARNFGIGHIHRDAAFVVFCDSDDTVDPMYLEKLVNASSGSDMVVCDMRHCYCATQYTVLTDRYPTGQYSRPLHNPAFLSVLKSGLINSPCNKLYRAGIIRADNLRFDTEVYNEDINFNIDYLLHCQAATLIPDALYNYIHREGSVTAAPPRRHITDYETLQQKLHGIVGKSLEKVIDDFVSYQYNGYILRLLRAGDLDNAKEIVSRPLVKRALDNHMPYSKIDRLQTWLIKNKLLRLYSRLFLKSPSK